MKRKLRRLGILIFICFCLGSLITNNFPSTSFVLPFQSLSNSMGLSQLYNMFSAIDRGTLDVRLTAITQSAEEVEITEEPSTYIDRNFFQHKKGKFLHWIQMNFESRRSYLDYLCRTRKDQDNQTFVSITFIESSRRLYPRAHVRETGEFINPEARVRVFDRFNCEGGAE